MHLTLGILRQSQAVSYALSFFWLDGEAVHCPSAGNANRWLAACKTNTGKINIMGKNKTKLLVSIFIGLIAVLIIGVLYYRVKVIIDSVFVKIPSPPSAILQVQNLEQTAGVGTYCWDGSCGDFIAIITPKDALSVKSPIIATLKLSTDIPLSSLLISVNPASKLEEYPEGSTTRAWKLYPRNYDDLLLQQEQTINLELERGLYVIVITAGWNGWGDAMYGFLIDVQ